ncbi:response regulator transcription factor [Paenibacillus herberti]|uniref:DNA-binding response regulator n=1 Tax=Paenibacillus herberti TaxID=1619309 RepID=A0A229P4U7_9BACL|nr:response regulator [Paenibacillus herberti]OXM16974.1 hypothetical protein CGZ75_10175 [Paenibacillus herberti]
MYNLLIVDDEPLICEGIRSKIIRMNRSDIRGIRIAHDGREAMDLVNAAPPDIIITDIKMPKMDGITLLKSLSKERPSIKFIILSGYGDYEYVREAFKYGASDYLLKPVSFLDLSDQLQLVMEHFESEEMEESVPVAVIEEIISSKQEVRQKVGEGRSVIDLAKAYIRQNYRTNLQLAEVANRYSMNYSYFSSLFKKETGMTFTSFLTKIRMEEACRLLRDPTQRVKEVAESVGYDNAHHFSRAFKNVYRFSPNQFRSGLYVD